MDLENKKKKKKRKKNNLENKIQNKKILKINLNYINLSDEILIFVIYNFAK